ncbi:MAG: hypothetical protein D6722_16090 [Bacteroidetes bacterium]|nr:MAG: hypothetical protein D6722_16090 [Bacteroidota bacterium]
MHPYSQAYLHLDPSDNVIVLTAPLEAGETLNLPETAIQIDQAAALGDPLAARAIAPGEPIIQFGVVISIAQQAIPAGALLRPLLQPVR